MSFSAYNTHIQHKHTISRKQTCGVAGQEGKGFISVQVINPLRLVKCDKEMKSVTKINLIHPTSP